MTEESHPVGDQGSSFAFRWGSAGFEVNGDADLVREGFSLLREEILPKFQTPPNGQRADRPGVADNAADNNDTQRSGSHDADEVTIEEFFKQKNPGNEQEATAVLAYYAREYRQINEVDEGTMQALYNEVHRSLPDVLNAIKNAARKDKGWFESVEDKAGFYALTPAGENYVRVQLPKGQK